MIFYYAHKFNSLENLSLLENCVYLSVHNRWCGFIISEKNQNGWKLIIRKSQVFNIINTRTYPIAYKRMKIEAQYLIIKRPCEARTSLWICLWDVLNGWTLWLYVLRWILHWFILWWATHRSDTMSVVTDIEYSDLQRHEGHIRWLVLEEQISKEKHVIAIRR